VTYCLITETTSLPLNLRFILIESGKFKGLQDLLGMAFFALFTLLRMLPIPLLVHHLYHTDLNPHYNTVETFVAVTGTIPILLNLFWYKGIFGAFWAHVVGGKESGNTWEDFGEEKKEA
jgi:hypothetical protein